MVILLLCGGSSGDVVHATGPFSNNNKSSSPSGHPPTPRDSKRSRRRSKDRNDQGPPVSSVLVQSSKGGDCLTHDTSFCRTETEEELESLTYGSRHEDSSSSPLPPIVEDEASSDGSLTEEDDEDLQLLLIPKAIDRNDSHQYHHHGAAPSTSSLMPVMELLVRTVLDDPTAPLSKSSCFDAVLKCGKDKAEMHRLRQQIRELQQQQQLQQQKRQHLLNSSTTNAAPAADENVLYEVRDLSALRSKRNGKMEAELRLRQSILRCWSPPSSKEDDDDEEEGKSSHPPNDIMHSDYSCIIPLDMKRNAAMAPSGTSATTPPKHPVTRSYVPSPGSDASTLPTTDSSEACEDSMVAKASEATPVRIDVPTKSIDEQEALPHKSVRIAL
jgi:hypothetical protein